LVQLGQPGPSGNVHPGGRGFFDSVSSPSSLRHTDSSSTWLGRISRGNGSDHNSHDGAAGGACGDGNAANGGLGGGNSGYPLPLASTEVEPPGHRLSRGQKQITELEIAKPIEMEEAKRYKGTPRENFDT